MTIRERRTRQIIKLFLGCLFLGGIVIGFFLWISRCKTKCDQGTQTIPSNNPTSLPAENHQKISAGEEKFFNNQLPEELIYQNNNKIGNQRSYTIAVVAPKLDTNEQALEILRGVAQAQDKFNKSRQDQQPYLRVLIVKEEAGDIGKQEVKEIANALVKDEKVLGVVGHFSSGVTKIALPVYTEDQKTENNLVVISPTSTATNIARNSYFFRTVPNDNIAAQALAKYMIDILVNQKYITENKVAIFYDSGSDYSKSLRKSFRQYIEDKRGNVYNLDSDKNFDLNQTINEQNSINDQQVNQAIESAINNDTKVFMFALPSSQRGKVKDILKNQTIQRYYLLAGDGIYSANFITESQLKARYMAFAVPWHHSISESQKFVNEYTQLWQTNLNEITWRTATSYNAMQAFIQAIQNSGQNPTRQSVQQQLSKSDFSTEGVEGKVQFDNYGEIIGESRIILACPKNDNQDELEFKLLEQCPIPRN